MENDNQLKTLAICIPTYKRPVLLKNCILSAIKEAGEIPIKIFIVDDSVSSVNDETIIELLAKFNFIFYKKNEVNLGIDKNIQEAVDFSDCDYSWLVGEDDVFLPGSISRIYNTIQIVDANFIVANYRYSNETHTKLLGYALPEITECRVPVKWFVDNYLWGIGFIGACVIKNADWRNTDPVPYEGTYYTHVGRIISMIASTDAIYIVPEANIANRAQGSDTFTWKDDSFGVFIGFENMCKAAALHNIGLTESLGKAIEVFRRKIGYFSLKIIIRLRAENSYNYQQYIKYILKTDLPATKKKIFFIVSMVPHQVLKPFLFFYRKLSKSS